MNVVNSHLRVVALADVTKRYGAIVDVLTDAIGGVLDEDLPEGARGRLIEAVRDAEAQLASLDDSFARAIADLPEGGGG